MSDDLVKRLEAEAKLQAEEIDKTRRRADKWQSMVIDCEKYLKPGETPAERIQREIDDCLALMKLLEKKQGRIEELEAKLKKAVEALQNIAGKVPYADDPWDIACVALEELEESTEVGVTSGSHGETDDAEIG